MTDTKEDPKPKRSGTLSLGKKLEASRVKQSFTGGRSKTVTVEVRKSRSFTRNEQGKIEQAPKQELPQAPVDKQLRDLGGRNEDRTLSSKEMEVRRRVLEQAQEGQQTDRRIEEERQARWKDVGQRRQDDKPVLPIVPILEEESKGPSWKDKLRRKKKTAEEQEEEDQLLAKGAAKKKGRRNRGFEDDNVDYESLAPSQILAEEAFDPNELKLTLEEELEFEDYSEDVEATSESESVVAVSRRHEEETPKVVRPINTSERVIMAAPDPEKLRRNLRSEAPIGKPRARREDSRMAAVTAAAATTASEKKMVGTPKKRRRGPVTPQFKMVRDVIIPESITVTELANRMAVRSVDVIKELMKMGVMATPDQVVDTDTAELIVAEFGHKAMRVTEGDVETLLFGDDPTDVDAPETLQFRAPVVTVMGHVDHGKTSLLDALRSADVVSGEAGGITQHIGAYQVQLGTGQRITFIDTPGHEAFTAMRARGASVTDIVILVVAADDGIKEQTVEAINHAKAAGVPIIVAVNKIDKPGADPQRVRNELMQYELVPEEYGGDVICVDVSAKAKTNLDKLAESVLVQAEVLELTANPNREARGVVIESRMEKGRGVVATLLVQKGTLKLGDLIIAGKAFGKVKALMDDRGQQADTAGPSMPVEMLGFGEVPQAGEKFAVSASEKQARDIIEFRRKKDIDAKGGPANRVSLEDLFSPEGKAKVKELAVIVKSDVHGSAEAIVNSLEKIEHAEVKVRVVHSGVGGITESDVALAHASNAVIVGFNVRTNNQAKALAQREKISIRYYAVIYDLVNDVKSALEGLLSPKFRENILGYAEVRQVFHVSKVGKVAGCMVTDGLMKRGARVRLLRDDVVIHDGALKTLKRFKDDAREVREGFECGMAFENYDDLRDGDKIEAYELEEVKQTLASPADGNS